MLKNALVILCSLVVFLATLNGCALSQGYTPRSGTEEILARKVCYAYSMGFYCEDEPSCKLTDIFFRSYERDEYKDIVFLNSEEEAQGYGSDTSVFWPTKTTEDIIDDINAESVEKKVNPEDFSLGNPVTLEDVVVRWQDVNRLLDRLGENAKTRILVPRNWKQSVTADSAGLD